MQVSMNECVSKNDVKTYLYLENVSHLSLNTLLTVTGWQISSKCFCHNNTKKVKKRGTNITLYQSHALVHVHVDKLSRGFTRWKTTHHSLKLHIILMPCICFVFYPKPVTCMLKENHMGGLELNYAPYICFPLCFFKLHKAEREECWWENTF